ncbi:MAG: pyridoxal phosphate-dependent aminotransferase [Candidatus Diapherotrites archaeon]|nr:pyridoxal phosphate-dependent aminotransferase [Candidatus Diapherotrites archaeon]
MAPASTRISSIPPSGIRRLFELSQGIEGLISLGLGEPDFPTPGHVIEAYKDALDKGFTKYAPTMGIPELRQAISEKYGNEYGVDYDAKTQVIVTSGASEAIFASITSIVNAGDEVIIPDPGFLLYGPIVRIAGGKPVMLELKEKENFNVMADRLNELITNRTKVLVLNLPSNPTGTTMGKRGQQAIADIVNDRDIVVISDEVYEKLVYGKKHTNFASLGVEDKVVTVNSFSKTYSMTGMRLGYAIGPKEVISNVFKAHQFSVVCVNTATQKAGVAALTGPQDCVEEMRKEYGQRRDILTKGLNSLKGVSCIEPQGAFYCFANITETGLSAFDLSDGLLTDARVVGVPGTAFGENGGGYMRFAYSVPREKLHGAIERMEPFFGGL